MTTHEIKVRGNNTVTLWQLVVSAAGVVVIMSIALLGFSNNLQDRINQNSNRITKLEEQQNSVKEWRNETSSKLEKIYNAVTELKIELQTKKDK